MSSAMFRRQQGLSLIELMVAMLIGLILILGVTQIFINNQRTYLFQQGQMGNQENARFTLALLSQELLKAGYRSDPKNTMTADSSLTNCTLNAGAGVAAVASSPSTSLCIQYQATNKTDVGCQGTALSSANQNAIATPYGQANPKIVERIAFDSATSSITCTNSASTQQLVTGVRDFRLEYGTGSGSDTKTITAWSSSPSSTATIAAVRYNVLMQSPGTMTIRDSTSVASPALTDWNGRYGTTYGTTATDQASIYQVVQGTIMLRNQMQ